MSKHSTPLLMSACLVVAIFVGCSNEPPRYPVAGKVLIDGEPVPTGSIQFVPAAGRPIASKIGEDGSFRLAGMNTSQQSGSRGVEAGIYQIGVSASEIVDEDEGEIIRHIPGRYADFRTSELLVEITEPNESMVIELTWDGAELPKEEVTESDEEATETIEPSDTPTVDDANDDGDAASVDGLETAEATEAE